MNFILGLISGILAQIVTFIQLQGQFKYVWMKDNPLLVALIGIPLSLLYINAVSYMVKHFNGEMWPSRILGFSIGVIVFTIMSWLWFKEPLTLKTLVCLGLACCILAIQLLWK
jgi:hypothetical protein